MRFHWFIGVIGFVLVGRAAEPAERSGMEPKNLHWAFQPLKKVELNGEAGVHPVDQLIRARLLQARLKPSEQADRRTLIRRAFIQVIGLPPSYEEVVQFEGDTRADAWERWVDGLLARPEFGERWARHWMDVARYSDAKGYVDGGESKYPFAYTYRDYLVDSFNQDKSYFQFIREQIAGDRLYGAGSDPALAGMGFLTVGSRYNFFPHEIIDDRIDVVTRGFLGLSVACARCHDHKFDPIPTEDYYSLYSIFANSLEPTLDRAPVLPHEMVSESGEVEGSVREAGEAYRKFLVETHEKIQHELRSWAGDYLRYVVESTPEHRTLSQPVLHTKRGLIREVSAYSSGAVYRWRDYLSSVPETDPVMGLWARLGRLPRDRFVKEVEGVLKEWREFPGNNSQVTAAFLESIPQSMADVANTYGDLLEGVDLKWRELVKVNPEARRLEDPEWEAIRQVLYGPFAAPSVPLEGSIDHYTLNESVEERKLFANIERVFLKAWNESVPRAMVLVDRSDRLEQSVFLRGNPKRLGDKVAHQIPASLTSGLAIPVASGSGRLELANALVDPKHPLTSRVMVNRVWDWLFGKGLVATPSDFGRRSPAPSNPELLDYLAGWFVEHDGSVKALIRFILLSETWQQDSRDNPTMRSLDPENTLLWRANRQRMDFEVMRDSMLSLSGLLSPVLGGPPATLAPDDPAHRRRTLYTFIDREKLPEICRIFDFPSPDITSPKRATTTVPQQTLFLLNNPFVLASARSLVEYLQVPLSGLNVDQVPLEQGVRTLFQQVYGRLPHEEESRWAADYIRAAVAVEGSQPWVELAQSLLLSNEFLFVD